MNTTDLLRRLKGVRKSGSGWSARCPAHQDEHASLSIATGEDGRTLIDCHAGCTTEAVVQAIGCDLSDLFVRVDPTVNGHTQEVVATYEYTDEDSNLLYQVLRFGPIKDFRQRRPDGNGGWGWKLGDVRRVLYRLPEVLETVALRRTVYLVEGEKDADRLASLGLTATTGAGGAGKWRREYNAALRDARVVILPDADDVGRVHARHVARELIPVADEVRLLELPALPSKGDVSDWLDAGGTVEELERLAKAAPTLRDGEETPGARPEDAFPLLRDLLERPELLRPPAETLPYLAWRARTTGLIGPDKAGKSTVAAHGVAALTRGRQWLGRPTTRGTAVVAAPDEAVSDTVRRLREADADPDRVRVLTLRPPDLLGTLDAVLERHPADLVVVDSLAEWARLTAGTAPDDGDAAGWGAVVRPLVDLSHRRDVALILLHHPRRSDGQYRGSGEIAAALDCLLEMRLGQNGEDPTLRRITGRARWPVEAFSLCLENGLYALGGGGALSMEVRVLQDITAHPGTTRTASHNRVGGRKSSHVAAVNTLVASKAVVDRNGLLYLPNDVEEHLL